MVGPAFCAASEPCRKKRWWDDEPSGAGSGRRSRRLRARIHAGAASRTSSSIRESADWCEPPARGVPGRFRFQSLPSAGPAAAGTINPADFTQTISRRKSMPIIDVPRRVPRWSRTIWPFRHRSHAAAEALEHRSRDLGGAAQRMARCSRRLTTRGARSGGGAESRGARKPLEMLAGCGRWPDLPLPDPGDTSDAEWQRLARLPNLVRATAADPFRDDSAGAPSASRRGRTRITERWCANVSRAAV